jgi:hypothetical protein
MYSELGSRPNTPVNVLLGWEILKSGLGLSDEDMYNRFLFDIQVRYALGIEDLNEGDFSLRTVYNFRNRQWVYSQETGQHLLEQAFEQVTDEQMSAYQVSSRHLRSDTTQIASDMARMSRLQLLVEVVYQVHNMLSPADQVRLAESFAPYVKTTAQHYIYSLNRDAYQPALAQVGEVMEQLVSELQADYGQSPAYEMLCRAFSEHFVRLTALELPSDRGADDDGLETGLQVKQAQALQADSLQSPHDPEATYRHKAGEDYQGYVTNITETCDPENEVDLIVKVQTAPNNADDADLLQEALPNLIARTDVKIMHNDGGFHSPELDQDLDDAGIEQRLTAIRGSQPDPDRIGLAHFQVETDAQNNPILLVCPEHQEIPVEAGKTPDRFIARPDADHCRACPLFQRCAARPAKDSSAPVLYFNRQQLQVARKRQSIAQHRKGPNLRAAVEATVRSVTHPLPHGKAPVRGNFRVSSIILASAFMVNLRRLHRFGASKTHRPDPIIAAFTHFPPFSALFPPTTPLSDHFDRFLPFLSHPSLASLRLNCLA